jgi:hypothetical protein
MQWIFGDEAAVAAIGANAPGDAALNCCKEAKRTCARGAMPGNGDSEQIAGMAVAIGRIDGDDVGLRNVGVAMDVVGAWVIDVVCHPGVGAWSIQLDVAPPQSLHARQDS